jgi:Zn-dependent peptidase ImmA (M78 family)
MLKQIIEATRLSPDFCASLLRVPAEHFREWMDGKRPVPQFVLPELSTILGVSEKTLQSQAPIRGTEALAPAIWFKLRADNLTNADREFVALVRRLGFFIGQLDTVRELRSSSGWRVVAQTVLGGIDRAAPPAVQGREAARVFRAAANLSHGQTGIGEFIRGRLRQIGLVVIESPIPKSTLEGCSFSIGRDENLRPCIFANTFKSTWFRRNEILLHEVCHVIFDLENDPVPMDFRDEAEGVSGLSEARARTFAQEALVPRSSLVHYANQLGIKWTALTPQQLTELIAQVHVEQKTLLRAVYQADLISEELLSQYSSYNCGALLRDFSPHALPTREYLRTQVDESPKWIAENRNTTVGTRVLRLPAGYVDQVIKTANAGDISFAKAAELLMMDRYTFAERFGEMLTETPGM